MPPVTQLFPLESYARGVESRTLGARLLSSLRYVFSTEVHTYAFSIAANVLLSLIPFVVLLLTFCRKVLGSQAAVDAILALLRDALPSNQEFIASRLLRLSASHKAQVVSLGMLLFTSTGVMLPLEVALNRIWGIPRNRSFIRNQAVSLGLAFCCGVLAVFTVLATAANLAAVSATVEHFGWTRVASVVAWLMLKVTAVPATILVFFLLYQVMPNGRVPVRPVLLSAVFAGLVTELAKHGFIWLLPWLRFSEVYGPFYVSVTLLMWSFVAAMVLLVGAHFAAHCPREAAAGPADPPPSLVREAAATESFKFQV